MDDHEPTLAGRLGVTRHLSPLRHKLERLRREFPSITAEQLDDWLVDVANARGAKVVRRPGGPTVYVPPPAACCSNEELVVAICQFERLDRPQILRLATQLISRGAVNVPALCRVARRERVGRVLAALARSALHVEPTHATWRAILGAFHHELPLRDVLLHWTRLAEPVMRRAGPNATGWKLAA